MGQGDVQLFSRLVYSKIRCKLIRINFYYIDGGLGIPLFLIERQTLNNGRSFIILLYDNPIYFQF